MGRNADGSVESGRDGHAQRDDEPDALAATATSSRETPGDGALDATADGALVATMPSDGMAGDVPALSIARRELRRGDLVGSFVVLEELGRGGMGVVVSAYDPRLDRRIAIKLLRADDGHADRSDATTRLMREAQAMARLNHEHIVTVYQVGTHNDDVFIAMELVEGTTLRGWLRERTRTTEEIASSFESAGRGLAAAHAAGLVHRDFKPDNVLVGADGRIRVSDFGLVASSAHGAAPERNTPLTRDLTVAGSVMGTPVYMAPEQHLGRRVDARADQFAFAVSLFEGLFDVRPFLGDTYGALVDRVVAGDVSWPASPPRAVPARIADALRRALRPDPDDRFPDMEALLSTIAAPPRRTRVAAIAGAGVASVAAAAIVVATRPGASDVPRPCRIPPSPVWSQSVEHDIATRIEATGLPHAPMTARRLTAALTARSDAIHRMRISACEATHVVRSQSEPVLDLRMACLDDRDRQIAALVSNLTEIPPERVQVLDDAVAALAPVDDCADLAALAVPVPPPRDPAALRELDRLRSVLADVEAKARLGKDGEALRAIEPLLAETRALEYRPLIAEALYWHGTLLESQEQLDASEARLHDAVVEADAGRVDLVRARALVGLVWLYAAQRLQFDAMERAAAQADGVISRLGDASRVRAALLSNLGVGRYNQDRREDAIAAFTDAIAAVEGLSDEGARLDVLKFRNNRAVVLSSIERYDEAARDADAVLSGREALLGNDHPLTVDAWISVTDIGCARGAARACAETLETGLARFEDAIGASHSRLVRVLGPLGWAWLDAHEPAKALTVFQRWAATEQSTYGEESVQHMAALDAVGVALTNLGRADEAAVLHRRSLTRKRELLGVDHSSVADTLASLADAQQSKGDCRGAVPLYEEALTIHERVKGATSQKVGDHLASLGRCLITLGRGRAAVAALRRSLSIRELAGRGAASLASTRFALGRALHAAGDRSASIVELRMAWRLRSEAEPNNPGLSAEMARWIEAKKLKEVVENE